MRFAPHTFTPLPVLSYAFSRTLSPSRSLSVSGVERTERHDPAIWQSVMNAASPRPLKVKIEGIHEMHSTHKNKSSVQFAQLPIASTAKSIYK